MEPTVYNGNIPHPSIAGAICGQIPKKCCCGTNRIEGFSGRLIRFFSHGSSRDWLAIDSKGSNLCVVIVLDTLANPSAAPAGMSEHAYPMNE